MEFLHPRMCLIIAFKICLLSCCISQLLAEESCLSVSEKLHPITPEDFKVTRYDDKYVMCAAYYCSSQSIIPLILDVLEVNSSKDNVAIYIGQNTISFSELCSFCQDKSENDTQFGTTSKCIPCNINSPTNEIIEIHVRIDKPDDFDANDQRCMWSMKFNLTLHQYSCGSDILVNKHVDKECEMPVSSNTGNLETTCLSFSSLEKIFFNSSHRALTHEFSLNKNKETIIWNLKLERPGRVELSYSADIRNYLSIYEESLLIAKHYIGYCSSKNIFVLNSNSKNIFILYQNSGPLLNKSFLKIRLLEYSCPYFSTLNNGRIQQTSSKNDTSVQFVCHPGYNLEGEGMGFCHPDQKLPKCIPSVLQDNDMSDIHNTGVDNPVKVMPHVARKSEYPSVAAHSSDFSFKQPVITILEKNPHLDKINSENDPSVVKNNASEINMDLVATSTLRNEVAPNNEISVDGSGQSGLDEDREMFTITPTTTTTSDFSDTVESDIGAELENRIPIVVPEIESGSDNRTLSSMPEVYGGGTGRNFTLFSYPTFKRNLTIFLSTTAGLTIIVILVVIVLVIRQSRSARESSRRRRFDTFQNPIYEKPVVPLSEADLTEVDDKADLGNLSDCTMLE